jgi:hypothetical protein
MSGILSVSAHAQGVLDFADPCKDAEKQFSSTSSALRGRADAIIAEWDKMKEPPSDIRDLYVRAVKEAIYNAWLKSPEVGPLVDAVKKTKPDFDSQVFFFETIYPNAVSPEKEKEIVNEAFQQDYKSHLRPNFVADRQKLEDRINEQKRSLDENCKPDEFNRVIRSTFGRAIMIINANTEAAKNERGEIAKLVRLTSGISISDIQQRGWEGGENSELRKITQAIKGGPNSEVNKALEAIDPRKWKIGPPPNKLPDLPPNLPKIRF